MYWSVLNCNIFEPPVIINHNDQFELSVAEIRTFFYSKMSKLLISKRFFTFCVHTLIQEVNTRK